MIQGRRYQAGGPPIPKRKQRADTVLESGALRGATRVVVTPFMGGHCEHWVRLPSPGLRFLLVNWSDAINDFAHPAPRATQASINW